MRGYYYIKEGMMLARSPEWEMDQYGFYPDGIGDLIGRSAKAALVYDKPEMLQKCVDLLKSGRRWPDALSPPYPHPKRLPKAKKRYRKQGSITRDPIIGVICSLWLMPDDTLLGIIGDGNKWRNQIKSIKIRWWQNRPDLYHWKKYLETGKSRHKRKYEWWAKIGLSERTPGYVLNHMAWMAYVADSDKMQKKLWKYIPNWNLLLELLTDKYPQIFIKECVKDYKAKSGYQWSHDRWIDPPADSHFYLDEDDEYKLDKEILDYILER